MTLCDAYDVEKLGDNDSRIVMHLNPIVAPIKIAIFPLSKKLEEQAKEVYALLSKKYMCIYDDTGSIGKRYRRQDAIGTPYCVTIDFDTNNDASVTIRERDSMNQIRLPIAELKQYFGDKFDY